jgi:hypothetical protein
MPAKFTRNIQCTLLSEPTRLNLLRLRDYHPVLYDVPVDFASQLRLKVGR